MGRETSDVDLAWVAGFFDGEGCITVIQHRRSPPVFELAILTGNTNYASIERCKRIMGGRISYQNRKDGHRPTWWWRSSGQDAKRILRLMLPHLTVKREQAEAALEFPMPGHRRDEQTGRMLPAGPLSKVGQCAAYGALRGMK